MTLTRYEYWEDEERSTGCFSSAENITLQMDTLSWKEDDLIFQYAFEAATWEEACAIHSLRQGHGPHYPMGKPENCPACGSWYYPQGSGHCWKCGI